MFNFKVEHFKIRRKRFEPDYPLNRFDRRIVEHPVTQVLRLYVRNNILYQFIFQVFIVLLVPILLFYLSKANVDDRNAKAITKLTTQLFGKLFGDKGYISKVLTDMLWGNGILAHNSRQKKHEKQGFQQRRKAMAAQSSY